jgi:zinc/manganese transport system permease protein
VERNPLRSSSPARSSPLARYSARSSASARAEAELSAIVGALLVMGILSISRPLLFATIDPRVAAARGLPVAALSTSLALSSTSALASLWLGITLAYLIPSLPPSSAIIGVAAALYTLSFAATSRPRLPWLAVRAATDSG